MVPECQHMKPVGGKCGSPALKGKIWCYFHSPQRLRPCRTTRVRYFLELAVPDSRAAVQAAIREVMQKLAGGDIDSSHAGQLLYALQLASQAPKAAEIKTSPRVYRISAAAGLANIYTTASKRGGKGASLIPSP